MTEQTLDFVERGAPGDRLVRTLVALGDSTTVGLGDPVPGGGWRGFGPLLAGALGDPDQVHFANLSFTGARARCVRTQQLPRALRLRPDAAVIVVGMNDTLRSDFDPVRIREHMDSVVGRLVESGAVVATVRYHDHGAIFRLPGPLHRVLRRRIEQVNEAIDAVVARHGAQCLDLHALPGTYDLSAWGVDRLHPSELGHRVLARGFGELLARAGCAVPAPVSLDCSGGRRVTPLHHAAWLVCKGIPWLCRRSFDLLPHGVAVMVREIIATRRERKAQRARRRVRLVEPGETGRRR